MKSGSTFGIQSLDFVGNGTNFHKVCLLCLGWQMDPKSVDSFQISSHRSVKRSHFAYRAIQDLINYVVNGHSIEDAFMDP